MTAFAWRSRTRGETSANPKPSEADPRREDGRSAGEALRTRPSAEEGARFRIEDVYSITGMGCVVLGELLDGRLRAPARVRVVPGPSSATPAQSVELIAISVNRTRQSELRPGVRAALTLKGVAAQGGVEARLEGMGAPVYRLTRGDLLLDEA